MATIKQIFSIGKQIQDLSDSISGYQEMYSDAENMMFTQDEAVSYQKQLDQQYNKIQLQKHSLATSATAYSVSTLTFAYNYNAKTARFGFRGQDIQDQLKVQDKLFNAGASILGATITGGIAGGTLAIMSTLISEAISVSIQNQAYEYRKQIDAEQKELAQERIGRAVYNNSRVG